MILQRRRTAIGTSVLVFVAIIVAAVAIMAVLAAQAYQTTQPTAGALLITDSTTTLTCGIAPVPPCDSATANETTYGCSISSVCDNSTTLANNSGVNANSCDTSTTQTNSAVITTVINGTTSMIQTGPEQVGGPQILNDSLLVNNDGASSNSTLTLIVDNTGSIRFQQVQVSLSNTLVLNEMVCWMPGSVITFSIGIPQSEVAISHGATYRLEIHASNQPDGVFVPGMPIGNSEITNVTAMTQPSITD